MNIADTLSGLLRRWYVTVPGVVLSIALAAAAWVMIRPDYERTATQLLIPGAGDIPAGSNPFLYIGGLDQAADVVVGVASSEDVVGPLTEQNPGAKITIGRDPSTSGPSIVVNVVAKSDASAEAIIDALTQQTSTALATLQDQEKIDQASRITIVTTTSDTHSTLQQKTRVKTAAIAGVGGLVLTLLLASAVDGLVLKRRRRVRPAADAPARLKRVPRPAPEAAEAAPEPGLDEQDRAARAR